MSDGKLAPLEWRGRMPVRQEIEFHGVKHKLREEGGLYSERTLWQVFFAGSLFPHTLACYLSDTRVRWGYVPLMTGQVPDSDLQQVIRVRALDQEGTPTGWPLVQVKFQLEDYIRANARPEDLLWLLRKMRDEGFSQYALQMLVEEMRAANKGEEPFEERALTVLDMITGFVGNSAYKVFE